MHKDVYIWQRYFYDTTIFFEFRTVTHYFSHSSFIVFSYGNWQHNAIFGEI